MPFWSGETLQNRGGDVIEPFDRNRIDCNAYNLRMGAQYYRTADHEEAVGLQRRITLNANDSFVIPAGQFAFLLSKETVAIPHDAMAFLSMRTGIKFQGLINVSGFHVDPGYRGKLVYAVYNASPSSIQISENDEVFKIWFCSLDLESQLPFLKGPDEGLYEITGDMIRGMNREILSLQSLANELRDQKHNIDTKFSEQKPIIDQLTFVWRAIILGVVALLVASLLAYTLPSLWALGQRAAQRWHLAPVSRPQSNSAPPSSQPGAPNSQIGNDKTPK